MVGVSMGGMVATEIATRLNPAQTVLISSVPSSSQIPFYFKWASKFNLQQLVPVSLFKSASILKRFFTTETPEDKIILKQLIRESDPVFVKWAMDAILKWDGPGSLINYVHIHGTRDELLPLRFTKPTHKIAKGGHLMVLNRADEINQILSEVLSED
ncbi:MAG: alpha/beta hydrolase [Chitinophagaceae bacterium]|nr:alpha/beta hydrolase [Chitinophagaceae bacterium]